MAHETRKGGLGRGLAALIPDGNQPRLGSNAARIVFGDDSRPTRKAAASGDGRSTTERPVKNQAGGSMSSHGASVRAHGGKQALDGSQGTPVQKPRREVTTPHGGTPESLHADYATPIGATYREVPVGLIAPNRKQPREVFDEQAMDELIHSIKEFGLLQPIVVREVDDGYEIIMGERRWRAATAAGLREIPAIVRNTDDEAMLRDALLENIHRVQLNPLEEAAAYQQLLEEFGVTQAQLADRLGRSRPVITNMIRLLALPVAVQRRVAAGVLSAGHARALLGLTTGAEAQEALANRVVAEGLSVRATEEAVKLLNGGHGSAKPSAQREKTPQPEYLSRGAHTLADTLDTRVSVQMGKKKGKIVVEFADKDDFERIIEILHHGGSASE